MSEQEEVEPTGEPLDIQKTEEDTEKASENLTNNDAEITQVQEVAVEVPQESEQVTNEQEDTSISVKEDDAEKTEDVPAADAATEDKENVITEEENVEPQDAVSGEVPDDTQTQEAEDQSVDNAETTSADSEVHDSIPPVSEEGTIIDTEDNLSIKLEIEETQAEEVEEEQQEAHPLDELTDQQVIDIVNDIEAENRHLELENMLFESFLMENDPSLLEGLEEIMQYLIRKASVSYHSSLQEVQDRPSMIIEKQRLRLDSYTSITSIAEGKGPKINLSQKTDMVMRAMEDIQSSLESFLKRTHIAKRNLKSELEEFSIREAEIKEATDIFEYNVVTQGFDKLTQRIPAEKFIRYMEEWLKSAQLQIEKLRLRIATLKVQYKKVSQQLIQRQELGENVHAVDFDQLEIENKHFIEKIEQKNIHLVELKKMNGSANLVLSTHKKFLQKQQDDCNKIKLEIEEKNNLIESTEKECFIAEEELNEVYEKYENCKKLKNQYSVPDVMEYVKLKEKLHDLKKNIKIWVRRRKIQDIALNTCIREMKNLTGSVDIDPSWFEDIDDLNSDDSSSIEN